MSKRVITILLCFVMLTSLFSVSYAEAPAKKHFYYTGSGNCEIQFKTKFEVKNIKVVAKQNKTTCKATDFRYGTTKKKFYFRIKNIMPGMKYSYKISGIRKSGTKKYGTVSGTFTVPKLKTDKLKKMAKAYCTLNNYKPDSNLSNYKITKNKPGVGYKVQLNVRKKILGFLYNSKRVEVYFNKYGKAYEIHDVKK
ncbi:MAG: hypothetical protein MJ145_01945 [Clostridia bacterium]|nr:hypothetical protein [Clostridia bacterium]